MQVNCSVIFKTNPTDRGMCCTFNALAAEKIYRESKFSESVSELQKQNVLDSFERKYLQVDIMDQKSKLNTFQTPQICLQDLPQKTNLHQRPVRREISRLKIITILKIVFLAGFYLGN